MNSDPLITTTIGKSPAMRGTLGSGGDSPCSNLFDELASLFTLAHMRLRRERVIRKHRSANGGKRSVSSLSRQVSLDDVAHSAKLATGDGGISENERSET